MTYKKFKTTDNVDVYLNPLQIGAIEVLPASARSEASVRVYTAGYKFNIKMEMDEFVRQLGIDYEPKHSTN